MLENNCITENRNGSDLFSYLDTSTHELDSSYGLNELKITEVI